MKWNKIFFIAALVIAAMPFNSYGQTEGNVPDSVEFAVLKELYTSLYGENWIDNTGWPDSGNWPASATAAEMDTWYGIRVLNYDIVEINLYGNNLTGTIPGSIGQLKALKDLSLNNNLITDPLPDSLSQCSLLDRIYLADNIIMGEIPPSWGQLNIRTLHIYRNGIMGSILPMISGMNNLIDLDINNNQFEGELRDLSGLPNLQRINISSNKFSGPLPGGLFNNSNLISFGASKNFFSDSIPEEIGLAVNLQQFHAAYNQLTYIPASINNCINLNEVQIQFNALRGELLTLSALNKLQKLYLHENQLTGDPFEAIKYCPSLEVLYLSNNTFSGEIPLYISQFINLKNLHLGFNNFTGALPESIGELINLEVLTLRGCNDLTGLVPDVFQNLTKLNTFDLSVNQFEDQVPKSICALPLQYLDLSFNKFSGDIPECYGGLNKLITFRIDKNYDISGSVPENFKDFHNLKLIYANSTGILSIPEFKNHPNKQNLDINMSHSKINPASIEKNLDGPNTHSFKTFYFGLQSYGGETYYEVDIKDSLLIEAIPGGVNATYTWEKYDSVNSVYVDVTSLNESSDSSKYLLNTPDTTDFGHYRAIIENSWIPQIFNSGPIIVNPYTGNTIYAIKSGDWHDLSLWSATENGSSSNALPRNKDSVIIRGHVVNVLQSTSYYDAALLQDPLNETGLIVRSGTMTVTGNIRLRRESHPSPVYFQVVEQGNVEVIE